MSIPSVPSVFFAFSVGALMAPFEICSWESSLTNLSASDPPRHLCIQYDFGVWERFSGWRKGKSKMAYYGYCLRHWLSLTLSNCIMVKNIVQLRKQWRGRNVDERNGKSTRHARNKQVNMDTVGDKGKRQEMKLPKSLTSAIDMRFLGSGGYGAKQS